MKIYLACLVCGQTIWQERQTFTRSLLVFQKWLEDHGFDVVRVVDHDHKDPLGNIKESVILADVVVGLNCGPLLGLSDVVAGYANDLNKTALTFFAEPEQIRQGRFEELFKMVIEVLAEFRRRHRFYSTQTRPA